MSRSRTRSPRGLNRDEILEAAFQLMSSEGEGGFSLRKLGAKIGCDPMTVLHHFRSKEELLRQIAERALQSVALLPSSGNWKRDLTNVASAYRNLAFRHPRLFHLHFRFHATGPLDHQSSEVVYRALLQSGMSKARAAELGLAFYAFVLGFALAETEGLLLPLSDEEKEELLMLPEHEFPATRSLVSAFKSLNPNSAFSSAIDTFIEGVAVKHGSRADAKAKSSRNRGNV